MSWKCSKYRKQIDQNNAGSLDHASRRDLEKHLANCPACSSYWQASQKLQAYTRQWQEQRGQIGSDEAPAGLNSRIMTAIREEAARQGRPVDADGYAAGRPTGNRPMALRRYAGVAAAVLLLLVGWQILWLQLQHTRTGHELAVFDLAGKGTLPATRQSDEQNAGNTTEKAVFGDANWQLYSGNFADVMTPCTNSFGTSASATTTAGSSAKENTSGSEAYQPADTVAYQNLLALLDQATAIRIYTRRLPAEQNLILAAFPASESARQYDAAKNALASCATPFRIEIIKIDDLPAIVDGFSGELLGQSVDSSLRGDDGLSWIMILMGA